MPGGELLDKIRSKRTVVAVGAAFVALSALVIAIRPTFPLVSIGLVLQGVTGGFLGPAIAAISLTSLGYPTNGKVMTPMQSAGMSAFAPLLEV